MEESYSGQSEFLLCHFQTAKWKNTTVYFPKKLKISTKVAHKSEIDSVPKLKSSDLRLKKFPALIEEMGKKLSTLWESEKIEISWLILSVVEEKL